VSSGRERVHLVVERTDGSRIIRVPAPRWLVSAFVGMAGLLLVAGGALYRDYVALKAQRAEFAAQESRLADQQSLIDGFQERLAQMRAEVERWGELRAKIWQPFGPSPEGTPGRSPGVGGGTALRLLEPAPAPALSVLDELERLATVVMEEGESLRALERLISKAGRVLASLPSRWPVRGPVNSDFGKRTSPWAESGREFHSGLDIGAARGSPVIAPAPGTVVFSGHQPEYGVTLIVDHGHDVKTLYGHLSRATVSVGDRVQRGEVMAYTGNTGRSSGPHLHYEIQVAGQAVDPRGFLWD
jgi:murein DD-endopeptidase MepM/ murein hydrolase activator NlpD